MLLTSNAGSPLVRLSASPDTRASRLSKQPGRPLRPDHLKFLQVLVLLGLGVILDSKLTFDAHISAVCKNAHFNLRALRHIRSSLTTDMATSIAVALVQSRLDYTNSLLYRVSTRNIHKLQRCQNTAARLILQQSFTPSIQDLMNQLHWLQIQARIDFKIATLTYKALSSGQPAYLRELISPYKPSRQLWSSDQSLLTIPRTNLTIGQRAFS